MKNKFVLLILFFLTIGFASLNTNIFLNGTFGLAFAENDFRIIFTGAKLDSINKKNYISEDKQLIKFNSSELKSNTATLNFGLANTSLQYDAEVQVFCTSSNEDNYSFIVEPSKFFLEAGKDAKGLVNITTDNLIFIKNRLVLFSYTILR